MSLSDTKIAELESAKESVQEWLGKKVEEVEETAAFLGSVDVTISALSKTPTDTAVASARALIDSIVG